MVSQRTSDLEDKVQPLRGHVVRLQEAKENMEKMQDFYFHGRQENLARKTQARAAVAQNKEGAGVAGEEEQPSSDAYGSIHDDLTVRFQDEAAAASPSPFPGPGVCSAEKFGFQQHAQTEIHHTQTGANPVYYNGVPLSRQALPAHNVSPHRFGFGRRFPSSDTSSSGADSTLGSENSSSSGYNTSDFSSASSPYSLLYGTSSTNFSLPSQGFHRNHNCDLADRSRHNLSTAPRPGLPVSTTSNYRISTSQGDEHPAVGLRKVNMHKSTAPVPASQTLTHPKSRVLGLSSSNHGNSVNLESSSAASLNAWPPAASLSDHNEDSIIPVGVSQPPTLHPTPSKRKQVAEGEGSSGQVGTKGDILYIRGGYDADFDPPLDEKNQCNICHFALHEPVQTNPCGHRFCRTCLSPIMSSHQSRCPVPDCGEVFEAAHPDNFCRREVLNLRVKCNNSVASCEWTGALKDLERHVRDDCTKAVIDCQFGCGMRMRRSQVAAHLASECCIAEQQCAFADICCTHKAQRSVIGHHFNATGVSHVDLHDATQSKLRDVEQHLEMSRHMLEALREERKDLEVQLQETENQLIRLKSLKITTAGLGQGLQDVQIARTLVSDHEERLKQLESRVDEAVLCATQANARAVTASQSAKAAKSQSSNFEHQLTAVNQVIGRTDAIMAEFDLRLLAQETTSFNDIIVWKIPDYSHHYEEARPGKKPSLYSLPFYPSHHGYNMDTRIGKSSNMSTQVNATPSNAGAVSSQSSNYQHQLTTLNQIISCNDAVIAEFDLRLLAQETTSFNGSLVWRIANYDIYREAARSGNRPSLYSPPFFSSRHGYKMCARVYLNGDGAGKNSHMSIFFVVMRGEFDSLLPWPFQQKVTLTLLDQSGCKKNISDTFLPDPDSSSFQRPTSEMNIASGCPRFVSLEMLRASSSYTKDNTIFIRVAVDTTGLPNY